ncbi:MAG: hypothetical protein KBE25_04250 [Laribacter sp.]|nr:hypothetical protein [Laribacter sp.]MBP9608546.1 hypothetical protein [Laribacter sp.]
MNEMQEMADGQLSDGRRFTVSPVFGRHIRQARRMQNEADIDYLFGLTAQVTLIDGKPITPHDLDDLPGKDVVALQAAVQKKMI